MRLREEKMEQQRLHQEDRVRRALERAQAEPKKKVCDEVLFSLFGSLRHLLQSLIEKEKEPFPLPSKQFCTADQVTFGAVVCYVALKNTPFKKNCEDKKSLFQGNNDGEAYAMDTNFNYLCYENVLKMK